MDAENRLKGIVTDWDISGYFRSRAEDIMLIEDIEGLLKGHIEGTFTDPETEKLNQYALQVAIDEIVASPINDIIRKAINRYFGLLEDIRHKPQKGLIEQVGSHLVDKGKSINDLTLSQYKDLLLHNHKWSNNSSIDDKAIRMLLEDVVKIRNKLAHFREKITRSERGRLHYCRTLLVRNSAPLPETIELPLISIDEGIDEYDEIVPISENTVDSRYTPLADYLQSQPLSATRLRLTFDEVEGIIGDSLPASASQHLSWWANDSVTHVQSKQWLKAGWRVSVVNMTEQIVTFSRVKHRERELAYITFFSALLTELRNRNKFPVHETSPNGAGWLNVMRLPRRGRTIAYLRFSFAHGEQFRADLYISEGQRDENKQVFDILYERKNEIESEMGRELSWERLNYKRASRIAFYHDGSIMDDEEKLVELREWAVNEIIRFENAITERAEAAIKQVFD